MPPPPISPSVAVVAAGRAAIGSSLVAMAGCCTTAGCSTASRCLFETLMLVGVVPAKPLARLAGAARFSAAAVAPSLTFGAEAGRCLLRLAAPAPAGCLVLSFCCRLLAAEDARGRLDARGPACCCGGWFSWSFAFTPGVNSIFFFDSFMPGGFLSGYTRRMGRRSCCTGFALRSTAPVWQVTRSACQPHP